MQITEFLFCETHPSLVVTLYCTDCQTGVCIDCILHTHGDHRTMEIREIELETRAKLVKLLAESADDTDITNYIRRVKSESASMQGRQTITVDRIKKIKDILASFQSELTQMENEFGTNIKTEICKLADFESKLCDSKASRLKIIARGKQVLDEKAGIELVVQGQQICASYQDVVPALTYTIQVADVEINIDKLMSCMQVWNNESKINYHMQTLLPTPKSEHSTLLTEACSLQSPSLPTSDVPADLQLNKCTTYSLPAKLSTTKPTENVLGPLRKLIEVKLDNISDTCIVRAKNTKHIVVRTLHKKRPVVIISLQGTIIRHFGGGLPGMVLKDCYSGISFDTTRELYLVPCQNNLHTFDIKGKLKANIYFARNLYGVAFIEGDDLYILSDRDRHRVYIFNPLNKQITLEFGSPGVAENPFKSPWYLWSGHFNEQPAFMVSDSGNGKIKLFNLSGKHIETYGKKCASNGTFGFPHGICADEMGRVIVCCNDLICFQTEGGEEQCRCLLSKDQLLYSPRCVDMDSEEKLLVVGTRGGTLVIFSYADE